MPKLDLTTLPETNATDYPPPHDAVVAGRRSRDVAAGLTDFGANITTLGPGAASSMRHWHSEIDELVVMLSGEAVLIDDGGETVMRAGDVATFVKDVPDAHQMVNRGTVDAVLLAVGRNTATERCTYPDADLVWSPAIGYVRASALGGS